MNRFRGFSFIVFLLSGSASLWAGWGLPGSARQRVKDIDTKVLAQQEQLAPVSIPTAPRLLFYASFDTGYTANESQGPASPTATNTISLTDEGRHGKGVLIGTDGMLSYENGGNLHPTAGTIAFWFKPLADVGTRAYWDRLFDIHKGTNSVADSIRIQFNRTDPHLYALLGDHAGNYRRTNWSEPLDWAVGRWRHVALTWDEETAALFVDGESIGFVPHPILPTSFSEDFFLGNRREGTAGAQGIFDDFRIYDAPLTTRDLASLAEGDFTFTVRGRITVSGVGGVGGVRVDIGDRSATTLPDGQYEITDLPTGSYVIRASKEGYTASPPQKTIHIGPSAQWVDFNLVRSDTTRPTLLFHAPFDNGYNATVSLGQPEAQSTVNISTIAGHGGDGVQINKPGLLSYESENNLLPESGTIAFWYKPLVAVGARDNWDRLFDIHGINNTTQVIRLQFNKADPSLYALFGNDTGTFIRTAIVNVASWTVGTWRHVALTWDDQSAILYLDGEAKGFVDQPILPTSLSGHFFLGNMREGNTGAQGVFDDLRIYDVPLQTNQLAELAEVSPERKVELETLNWSILTYRGEELVTYRHEGPLTDFPSRSNNLYPLSDQSNQGGWTLVDAFSDEFSGEAKDLTLWKETMPNWGRWEWRNENTWQENGLLKIRMDYTDLGNGLFYTSGIYRTVSPIRYGYFEVRMKASSVNPGTGPAFWLYNNEDSWTEIDWVELGQQYGSTKFPNPPNVLDGTLHLFRHPRFKEPSQPPSTIALHYKEIVVNKEAPFNPSDDFHVYAGLWTPTEITWFIDGVKLATRTNDFWDQPLWLTLSMGTREPFYSNPSPTGFPTTWEIDYVRTWKNAATADGEVYK